MERRRHIAETQDVVSLAAQSESDETLAHREEIPLAADHDRETEIHPEQLRIRRYIDSFDEDRLEEIFLEHFRRAGSEEETINWIPFDEVRIIYKTSAEEHAEASPAAYFLHSNKIVLFAHHLRSPEQVLTSLIHEELHAISKSSLRDRSILVDDDLWNLTIHTNQSETGFAKQTTELRASLAELIDDRVSEVTPHPRSGIPINEGATEFVTQKILRQYIEQTGSLDAAYPYEAQIKSGYFNYQLCFEIYTRILSYVSDVPLRTVVDGVIRAYLRNGNIVPPKLVSELSEAYPALLDQLSSAIENGEANEMVQVAMNLKNRDLLQAKQLQNLFEICDAAWEDRIEYLTPTKKAA